MVAVVFLYSLAKGNTLYAARENPAWCDVKPLLEKISKAQGPRRSDDIQVIVEELRIKKQALARIVDCSTQEVQSLYDKLAAFSVTGPDALWLQRNLLRNLESSLSYYEFQKSKISDLGQKGVKDFSRSLLTWRTDLYAPLRDNASSFMLWYGNERLLAIAEGRFLVIRRTLEGNEENREATPTLLEEARVNLRLAEDYHEKARIALRNFSGRESLEFIRESLAALNKTYENFFEITNTL